jgi:hypothetical protein
MVTPFTDNPDNAAVDEQHGTYPARGHTAIKRGALKGYAEPCRLTDGILLGMDGAHAMLRDTSVLVAYLLYLVTDIVAMGKAGRRTDIARDEQGTVAGNDTPAAATVAGGTF